VHRAVLGELESTSPLDVPSDKTGSCPGRATKPTNRGLGRNKAFSLAFSDLVQPAWPDFVSAATPLGAAAAGMAPRLTSAAIVRIERKIMTYLL
jgi:hypothetical protein